MGKIQTPARLQDLSPRLRTAVITLAERSEASLILTKPKKGKTEKVGGKQLQTSVEILVFNQGKKPSKPNAELSKIAKAVAEDKKEWYSYDKGIFTLGASEEESTDNKSEDGNEPPTE